LKKRSFEEKGSGILFDYPTLPAYPGTYPQIGDRLSPKRYAMTIDRNRSTIWRIKMKRSGVFILLGLLFGATFGVFLGAAIQNPVLGIGLGALSGVFLGLFTAAAVLENQNVKKNY
jgi:hypothetical protein